MLEAVVVISFFLLALLGVIYFREMYVKRVLSMRVARAALVGHAMAACKGDPRAAVEIDARGLTTTSRDESAALADVGDVTDELGASPEAEGAVDKAVGSRGFFGNPTATFEASAKAGALANGRSVFQSTAASRAYVACPDAVRPHGDDFGGVFGYVKDVFDL